MTVSEKIKKYGLTQKDWFQHKHYTIITRMGIDKIQAYEKIKISYKAIKVEPEFCVVQAFGEKGELSIETFGSSKYGAKTWDDTKKKWNEKGNTTTWYVMEMAEKRAMSRAVLKITGFYELGVFGEDESEDFKISDKPTLTIEQFQSAKNGTKPQIETVLNKFKMSADQRKVLTDIKDRK